MNPNLYTRLEALQKKIHTKFMSLYEKGEWDGLKKEMEAALQGQTKKALSITLGLNIYDEGLEAEMDFSHSGITYLGEAEPFVFESAPKVQEYIVNGENVLMPRNLCPACWNEWPDKFENAGCPYCNAELGKDIILVFKKGPCPKCGRGELSKKTKLCDTCDWNSDVEWARWKNP